MKARYVLAVGEIPISAAVCFCVAHTIGTHGDGPSAFGAKQYASYAEVLEAFSATPDNYKPYSPILGLSSDGYGHYIDSRRQADLVYYCNPYHLPEYYIGRASTLEYLELMGCLDYV